MDRAALAKVSRWLQAQKAAGRVVQPWEYQAALEAELSTAAGKKLQSRGLDISQGQLDLSKSTAASNEALARERLQMEKDQVSAGEQAGLYQLGGQLGSTYLLSQALKKKGGDVVTGATGGESPSMLSKVTGGIKDLASTGYDKLFGPSIQPSTVAPSNAAPVMSVTPPASTPAPNTLPVQDYLAQTQKTTPWEVSTVKPATSPLVTEGATEAGRSAAEAAAYTEAVRQGAGEGAGMFGGSGVTYGADGAQISGGLGSKAGSVVSKIGGPLAIVGAVSGIREAFGNTSAPYKDRTSAQQTVSAPGTAGAFLPAFIGKQVFGDSSDIGKAYDWMARGEETVAGEPLGEMFKGNIATGASKLFQAPQKIVGENLGETAKTITDVFFNPVGAITRQLGTCLIFGYLYGRSSAQVRTALIFCAKKMNEPKLVGYYSIAKLLISGCEKSEAFKNFVRKRMAEPFFRYMTWQIGRGEKPSLYDRAFSAAFLGACVSYYYSGLPLFYPEGYQKCVESTR